MVLDRAAGQWIDSAFRQLPDFLNPSDLLVINDTRVIRARVRGRLERGRELDVLFAGPVSADAWEVMVQHSKRIRPGDRIVFANGEFEGVFGETRPHGLRLLTMVMGDEFGRQGVAPLVSLNSFLEQHGHIPLPPYIERDDTSADATEYQTVFANEPGAVAAPTAGLHFTSEMFAQLSARGIEIVKLTLHVGVGTFIPVRTDDPREHVLKPERFELSEESAARLNAARAAGRRLIAVGTTSTRTLEYVLQKHGRFTAASGEADLFILPGYEFKAVGGMLTNFHLPRSTLLMLVSAFSSREKILAAYRHAIEEGYRFYSYGDCMLIR